MGSFGVFILLQIFIRRLLTSVDTIKVNKIRSSNQNKNCALTYHRYTFNSSIPGNFIFGIKITRYMGHHIMYINYVSFM